MTKKTPVPPMYPKPEAIKLSEPQRVVSVNRKTRTVTFAGSPPPELLAAAEREKRRLNLKQRLTGYAVSCLFRLMPHFGERPKYISAAKWKDVEQRVRLLRSLPENAPAEAHDDLRALQTLNQLVAELVEAGDYPDAVDRAICWAIDLGQLLQRGQTQIDHGQAVDVGRRNVQSRSAANQAKSQAATEQSRLAESEFNRRMRDGGKQTATLKAMSRAIDRDGKPLYGSFGALTRYIKTWKSLTPSE